MLFIVVWVEPPIATHCFVWTLFFHLNKFLKGLSVFTVCLQDGVILGVDSRTIEGETICDNNYEKIHYFPPNIY
jgi:hypothetical protein